MAQTNSSVQPIRFGPRDLLEYNQQYSVLICRECQYAIQKNAVGSHLLRHKIYRAERQTLLNAIARLNLLEPEGVPLPAAHSSPIDALPVILGWKCTVRECRSLTASLKRIKRHLSENHGIQAPASKVNDFACRAHLQTFFRGTKMRYFEVTLDSERLQIDPIDGIIDESVLDEDFGGLGDQIMEDSEQLNEDPSNLLNGTVFSESLPPQSMDANCSGDGMDLTVLSYFHHFTTTVCLTLPPLSLTDHSASFWQETIVENALKLEWLMSGLLALSAFHLATCSNDLSTKENHRQRAYQFAAHFSSATSKFEIELYHPATTDEAVAFRHLTQILNCLLKLAQWTTPTPPHPSDDFSIENLMELLEQASPPQPHDPSPSNFRRFHIHSANPTHATIQNPSDPNPSNLTIRAQQPPTTNHTPSLLLSRIRTLPSEIAQTTGPPSDISAVLATIAAISALEACCELSFASDELGEVWAAMTAWVGNVHVLFREAVVKDDPAALVVVARWARVLVRRTELCGVWFLKDLAERIVDEVLRRLPVGNLGLRGLVDLQPVVR